MDDRMGVGQIMTKNVVTTTEVSTLLEAALRMRENHVSGLPVVDANGHLTGVVSEVDLVRGLHAAAGVMSPRGILDLLLESAPERGPTLMEVCQHRLRNGRVGDVMTRRPTTVEADTTIHEAARLMHLNKISRLPVVDDKGQVIGIVTRMDILAAVAGAPSTPRGALQPAPQAAKVRKPGAGKGVGHETGKAPLLASEQRVYGDL